MVRLLEEVVVDENASLGTDTEEVWLRGAQGIVSDEGLLLDRGS